jgi:hypothetical protein
MKTYSEANQSGKILEKTGKYLYANFSVLSVYLILLHCSNLKAQPGLLIYSELGRNNASAGMFIKSAAIGQFRNGKNLVETGFQLNIKHSNGSDFSGFTINAAREFIIRKIPVELHGFYTRTFYSELLGETDYGSFLKIKNNHFVMTLGTSFRTYSFRKKAVADHEMDNSHTKFHENFNLLYSINYYLRSTNEKWNVGLSITDADYFIINQDTNPFFNLLGNYKLSSSLKLNAQVCYQPAGLLNLHVDHFGIFFRTGIIWNLK